MASNGRRAGRVGHGLELLERRMLLSVTPVTLATVTGAAGQVAVDAAGNVYGTTRADATTGGTVFRIAAGTGTVTTLATFGPYGVASDVGTSPANVVIDPAGNLFGTSGPSRYGIQAPGSNDTLWELPAGTTTVKGLTTFGVDIGQGVQTATGLAIDAHDDLFYSYPYVDVTAGTFVGSYSVTTGKSVGLASSGYHSHDEPLSVFAADAAGDAFVAFSLASTGPETDLYRHPADGSDTVDLGTIGNAYLTGMAATAAGDLFATTTDGRVVTVPAGQTGVSTVATLDAATGTGFTGPLAVDPVGDVYAATTAGAANGYGALVELPAGASAFTVVSALTQPQSTAAITGLTTDADGNLYGTITRGNSVTFFEHAPAPDQSTPTPTPAPTPTGVAVAAVSSTVPVAVVAGRPIHGTVRLSLTAGSAVTRDPATVVDVYATSDDGTATRVGTVKRRLKAGATATVAVRVRAAKLLDGTYTLTAQTADGSSVATVAPALTVSAPVTKVTATVAPATAAAGRPGVVRVTVTNTGNVATVGPLTVVVDASGTEKVGRAVLARGLRPGRAVDVRVRVPPESAGVYSTDVAIQQGADNVAFATGSISVG